MPQLFAAIILIGLVIFAVKVAILLLLLAGLIFRTKETIGLIGILAVFAGLAAYPLIGSVLLVIFVLVAIYRAINKPDDDEDFDEST
jgi:uncharacterized membrane protein